jgi:hypothetical protein
MTIKELYQWAKKNGYENEKIYIPKGEGRSFYYNEKIYKVYSEDKRNGIKGIIIDNEW